LPVSGRGLLAAAAHRHLRPPRRRCLSAIAGGGAPRRAAPVQRWDLSPGRWGVPAAAGQHRCQERPAPRGATGHPEGRSRPAPSPRHRDLERGSGQDVAGQGQTEPPCRAAARGCRSPSTSPNRAGAIGWRGMEHQHGATPQPHPAP